MSYLNGHTLTPPKLDFEILVIDSKGETGFRSVNGLKFALLSLENLFTADHTEENGENSVVIRDKDRDLTLSIEMLDTSGMVGEPVECGFIVNISSSDLANLDLVRYPILQQFRSRFRFSHARILTDHVSAQVGGTIYPLINDVETALRRYLVRFFIQKVGNKWWTVTAPRPSIDKANTRRQKMKGLSELLTLDVSLIDFDELGELIYRHNSAFNNQETLIQKIRSIDTMEQLKELQKEMQSNYTRFFKESFADQDFERKWIGLIELRNKMAHSGFLTLDDYHTAKTLSEEVLRIISHAESQINSFRFSIEEKQTILEKTINAMKDEEEATNKEETLKNLGIKVVGKIDLAPNEDHPDKVITEQELIEQLDEALDKARAGGYEYLGLKYFVTRHLATKGFAVGPSYSIINILKDKEQIEFYDVTDRYNGYSVKAVRHAGWGEY